jgi:hypothetical protein
MVGCEASGLSSGSARKSKALLVTRKIQAVLQVIFFYDTWGMAAVTPHR